MNSRNSTFLISAFCGLIILTATPVWSASVDNTAGTAQSDAAQAEFPLVWSVDLDSLPQSLVMHQDKSGLSCATEKMLYFIDPAGKIKYQTELPYVGHWQVKEIDNQVVCIATDVYDTVSRGDNSLHGEMTSAVVVCFNTLWGGVKHEFVPGPIHRGWTLADNQDLVYCAGDSAIVRYSLKTGTIVWRFSLGSVSRCSAICLSSDGVYFFIDTYDHASMPVVCLSEEGEFQWARNSANGPLQWLEFTEVAEIPAVFKTTAAVSTRKYTGYIGPFVIDDKLFVRFGFFDLQCFDPFTGVRNWGINGVAIGTGPYKSLSGRPIFFDSEGYLRVVGEGSELELDKGETKIGTPNLMPLDSERYLSMSTDLWLFEIFGDYSGANLDRDEVAKAKSTVTIRDSQTRPIVIADLPSVAIPDVAVVSNPIFYYADVDNRLNAVAISY